MSYVSSKGCELMTSFAEKLQAARYLSANAGSLAIKRFLRNLSPERNLALVHDLERMGMATQLDLEIPSWRTEQIVASTITLEPATAITIPANAPLSEDAHGWLPYRVRELQGVALDVESGLAFTSQQVIAQSGSGTRASRDASFVSGATIRVEKTQPVIVNGPIAPIGDVHHHYHVMLETVPRMLHAKRMNPDVRFATAATINERYQTLFGDLELAIDLHPPGTVLIGNPLVLVDQPDLFWPRMADLTALREVFQPEPVRPIGAVYFSRGTAFRQPANEPELQQALHDAGFEVVALTDYSLQDQWAIAFGAQTTAGPHGAALWATAALQPGTSLVELSSGEFFEGCYRRIAHLNEANYHYVALPATRSQPFGDALESATLITEYSTKH